MQRLYHWNSFILALGCAMETNVVPSPPPHTHIHKKNVMREIKQERRGIQWNAFSHYSNRLVAFSAANAGDISFCSLPCSDCSPASRSFIVFLFADESYGKCSKWWEASPQSSGRRIRRGRCHRSEKNLKKKMVKYQLLFHKRWFIFIYLLCLPSSHSPLASSLVALASEKTMNGLQSLIFDWLPSLRRKLLMIAMIMQVIFIHNIIIDQGLGSDSQSHLGSSSLALKLKNHLI